MTAPFYTGDKSDIAFGGITFVLRRSVSAEKTNSHWRSFGAARMDERQGFHCFCFFGIVLIDS